MCSFADLREEGCRLSQERGFRLHFILIIIFLCRNIDSLLESWHISSWGSRGWMYTSLHWVEIDINILIYMRRKGRLNYCIEHSSFDLTICSLLRLLPAAACQTMPLFGRSDLVGENPESCSAPRPFAPFHELRPKCYYYLPSRLNKGGILCIISSSHIACAFVSDRSSAQVAVLSRSS